MIFLLAVPALAQKNYSEVVQKMQLAMEGYGMKGSAYNRLAYIVDSYGPRVWGGPVLQMVIDKLKQMATSDGFENIRLEPVTNITHWIRNYEYLTMLSPRKNSTLGLTALGYSVSGSVTADVVIANNLTHLDQLGNKVAGKIVLFHYNWTQYHQIYQMRISGPSLCAKYGAVGMLIRSIASKSIYSVHTGYTAYDAQYKKIPAAAITVEDSDMIDRMIARGQRVTLHLNVSTSFQYNRTSSNLIFEIVGSEMPQKILLMGGHIDSWDTGSQTGANDDGGGVITVYQALRLLKTLNLRPKRTLRFIAWSGEESGQPNKGANQYVQAHKVQVDNHVLAFQSDLGSTRLYGFGLSGAGLPVLDSVVKNYLAPLNVTTTIPDGTAVDTAPLFALGVPQMKNLIKDSASSDYYFSFHHSAGDSMTMMDAGDMDSNVLGIAAVMYILGDLDTSLR